MALSVLGLCACQGPPTQSSWRDDCDRRGPISDQFVDVTARSGVLFANFTPDFRGGAVAVADIDGDELLDLLFANRIGDLVVYRNLSRNPDEGIQFVDQTAAIGIDPGSGIIHALATGDLDNDGDADLMLATAGLSRSVRMYENDGAGRFSFRTSLLDSGAVEHLLLVDIDDDGWLDIHTGNGFFGTVGDRANRLYMQRAPWSFERVTFPDGLPSAATWTTSALDVDGDGDRDLYVANDTLAADFGDRVTSIDASRAVDQLLRNDGLDPAGVPIFTDIAGEAGLAAPRSSMGGLVADFNDDGLLDLFVPDFGANKLLVQTGASAPPAFVDVAEAYQLRAATRGDLGCSAGGDDLRCLLLSWGSALADFDGDGARELMVVNGPTLFTDPFPPQLYFWPNGNGRFIELSPTIGCAEGHGLIAADLDRDGDLDLAVSVREGNYRVYENRGPAPAHWLVIRLRGTVSNRDGRGAVITAHLPGGRSLIEVVGAGGVAFSSLPAEVFLSTGAERPTQLTVAWPSGRISRVSDLPDRQVLVIGEEP